MMNLSKETKITTIYFIIGLCWIYFSDTFLLIINNEKNFIIDYQLYKSIFYIVLSTIFLYFILHKNFKVIRKQEEMLNKSKKKIKEQKDFYSNVIDLVPHLIFAKDKDGNFLLANKAVADIYNNESKDIIGKNHYKLHNKIFAYETKLFEHSDHEVLEKNKEVINEEKVTNISGNSEIFHTRKIPLSTPDGENAVLGVAVNISELKEKEKQLEIDNKAFKTLNTELEESYNEIIELAKKIEQIIDITASLDGSTIDNTDEFLSDLLHSSLKIIAEADYGTVARIIDDKLTFVDAFGYDIAKLNKLPITNKYLSKLDDIKSLDIFLKEVNDSLIVSFHDDHDKVALLYLSIDKKNPKKFKSNSLRVMSAFSNLANGFFKIQKYYQVEDEFQQELIVAITQILELHDTYTEGHSKEVAELSRKIAEKMNLSKIDTEIAFWAGMVHDIGKILVPNEILNKRGPLTDEEYNVIKKHPGFGYQTLEHSGRLKEIAKYILHHHERWDGNGYPKGLQNDEIPLISRILCVADSWNAMRSNRPYRNSLPLEKAINEIEINTGKQFCPDVVEAFKEVYNF